MEILEKGAGRWRFGVFEVNAPNLELRRSGVTVKIREQPFRILVYLLEHPGELVSREDIRRVLWPVDTFVDFEHSLNTAIKKLREALGDSAEEPLYIETVPKRGYRFIAPVTRPDESRTERAQVSAGTPPVSDIQAAAPAEPLPGYRFVRPVEISEGSSATSIPSPSVPDTSVQPLAERRTSNKWFVVSVILAFVILILVWAGPQLANRRNAASRGTPSHFRVVPVTNLPGAAGDPALSPDGKQVAFFWEPEGREIGDWAGLDQENNGLYLQLVGGGEPLRLTNSKGGFIGHAAWSPDGRELAFGRCNDEGGAVYTVSALGGPEHKVTDVICLFGAAGYPNWTPDGKALVLVDRCGSEPGGGIILFSLETGQKRCITDPPPGNVTDLDPVLSPDGRTVAFVRMSTSAVGDIYTVPIEGGNARRLTKEDKGVWQLMWSADGQSIIFLSSQTGIDGLRRIPAQGGTIELESEYPGVGSLSKDGFRLAYVQPPGFWASSASIWRADLAKVGGGVARTQEIASSNSFDGAPQISPDGSFVIFESQRSAAVEIWKCNADGRDPVQLTSFGGHAGTPRWSPDGKWIAFDYRPQEHSQIWVIDADGRNAHAVVSGAGDNVVPSWATDEKAIMFASNRTGQYQVWVHDLETGRESQITARGGFASFESPDGTSLFYTKFDSAGIWTVPRNGGAETRLTVAPHLGYWGDVAVIDQGIYLLDSEEPGGPTIDFYAFKTKAIEKVFTFPKDQSAVPWVANLSASRDGRRLYFAQGTTKSSIVMAEFRP